MLTIRPAAEADYTAIVNWNADKDEAYLFQWAGFTAYQGANRQTSKKRMMWPFL